MTTGTINSTRNIDSTLWTSCKKSCPESISYTQVHKQWVEQPCAKLLFIKQEGCPGNPLIQSCCCFWLKNQYWASLPWRVPPICIVLICICRLFMIQNILHYFLIYFNSKALKILMTILTRCCWHVLTSRTRTHVGSAFLFRARYTFPPYGIDGSQSSPGSYLSPEVVFVAFLCRNPPSSASKGVLSPNEPSIFETHNTNQHYE